MRLLLVRHGESEGNVDAAKYVEKGDSNIGLTEQGWRQAFNNGKFLGEHYKATGTKQWPIIYISSYQRPKETFAGMVEGMKGTFAGDPALREEPRLIEKFFGAASAYEHLKAEGLSADVVQSLLILSDAVYKGDPFSAKNLFGESTKENYSAVKSFMDGTLARLVEEGKDDFLIVTHGAVIQSFIMAWGHVQMHDKKKIGNPGNCDIIEVSGHRKNWEIIKIYDGENARPVDINIMEHIKPFGFSDLPAIPDFLKQKP